MNRRGLRREHGQAAAEYAGVLVLLALIFGALAQLGVAERVRDAIGTGMCELLSPDRQCDDGASPRAKALQRQGGDPDGDGLSTKRERELGLAWGRADTDGDGVSDGQEVRQGLDPKDPDTDRDGLEDAEEYRRGTNPKQRDGDRDGLTDGQEVALGTRPGQDQSDSYGGGFDGLTDYEEVILYGTDPRAWDTDGDGTNDGAEVDRGDDPLVDERDFLGKVGSGLGNAILDDPTVLVGAGGLLKGGLREGGGLLKKLVGKGDDAVKAVRRLAAFRRAAAVRLQRARDARVGVPGDTGPLNDAGVKLELDRISALSNGTKQTKRTTQLYVTGGFKQATEDFDVLTRGVQVTTQAGGVRTATIAGGIKVNVRRGSTQGSPTLELQPRSGPRIKLRYDD